MIGEPPRPPALAGSEATAKILKAWLVDGGKTRSGVIGVDDTLHVVSVQTFQHMLTQPALDFGMKAAIGASATGIVAYNVTEKERPELDRVFTAKLKTACEDLNMTLLDVLLYSLQLPKGWLSARQQNII
jgi:hypothetical protein